MAITVSFTGSAMELLELFQDNKFLELIRKQGRAEEDEKTPAESIESRETTATEIKETPPPPPVKEPEEPKVYRQQMLHAVQEYAVRMYNRYKEFYPDLNVKDMCAQLMIEHIAGSASHTSMVGDMFIEQVYHHAVNDYIPSAYSYLK
jgi:hypothetical protein